MRILLVSTYELGHQPLHLASPAAALEAAGHEVRCVDVSVEPWGAEPVDWAEAVAFSVPMHTAARLARKAAESVRQRRPGLPVAFYGLYAHAGAGVGERSIAGEYEPGLLAWLERVQGPDVDLRRQTYPRPARSGLPPLERYAHLAVGAERLVAGYVEATRGCAHRCRHCPVPVVYDGRTRKVPVETVLADVEQQVRAGARHITFGDPDFLNRANHALEVTEALHAAYPDLTYDVTAKVEHLLRYHMMLPRLRATGCLFVVSAFECLNEQILRYLDKGHTAEEAAEAVHLLRGHEIEVRPSWLPFTPWAGPEDVADILDFVVAHDLIGNVDPVQYTIRLLIPEGSLLLELPELQAHLGPYDPERLTYTWRAADPAADELQTVLARIVGEDVAAGKTITETFWDVRDAVAAACHNRPAPGGIPMGSGEGKPRLTEPWFC